MQTVANGSPIMWKPLREKESTFWVPSAKPLWIFIFQTKYMHERHMLCSLSCVLIMRYTCKEIKFHFNLLYDVFFSFSATWFGTNSSQGKKRRARWLRHCRELCECIIHILKILKSNVEMKGTFFWWFIMVRLHEKQLLYITEEKGAGRRLKTHTHTQEQSHDIKRFQQLK